MSREANRGFLTVTTGPGPGRGFILPPGPTILGRVPEADVVLTDSSVSRRHAELMAGDRGVVIRDLGSSNGTFVNGDRLTGTTELRDGDELRVGSVVLRFAARVGAETLGLPTALPVAQPGSTRFGDVRGPIQTGAGEQRNVGRDHHAAGRDQYVAGRDQHLAGRDQHFDQRVNLSNDYDLWDEVWQGQGPGRVLMMIGGLIAVAGFGMWVAFIFSGVAGGFEMDNPFLDLRLVGDVPLSIAGFVSFFAGGLLAAIGGGMSKAARKREEQARKRW